MHTNNNYNEQDGSINNPYSPLHQDRVATRADEGTEQQPLSRQEIKSESSFSVGGPQSRHRKREQEIINAYDDDFKAADTMEKGGARDEVRAFDGLMDLNDKAEFFSGESQTKSMLLQQMLPKKMNAFQTYIAVIKAYCAINVLLLPRSFVNGGYLLSPISILVAVFFETLCAVRLAEVAQAYEIYSYPLLMQKALGDKGLHIARLFLSLAHFQFSIGQVTFTLKSLQSTMGAWTGTVTPLWVFGLGVVVVYSPIVWVRYMKSFSKGFALAAAMIVLAVISTSVFALRLVEEQGGSGPEYVPVNEDQYLSMIGFAFFMFEGIGCLLPVMRETEKPEQFGKITVAALVTLCTIYLLFSSLCYYAWGSDLNEPVVTEMLPADNSYVQLMKLLFCINLVFSYPLTMQVAFSTLEAWCFGRKEAKNLEETLTSLPSPSNTFQSEQSEDTSEVQVLGESSSDYWKTNVLRSMIVALTVLFVLYIAEHLDKFISVAGAIFGMTNVLLLPAICHLRLQAKTQGERCFDIFIIILACLILIFGPATIIMQW